MFSSSAKKAYVEQLGLKVEEQLVASFASAREEALAKCCKRDRHLSQEEQEFLSDAQLRLVSGSRAALRVGAQAEREELAAGRQEEAAWATQYKERAQAQMEQLCAKAIQLLDNSLLPSAFDVASKVLYIKMKGDYNRYMAEFSSGGARAKATMKARLAYEQATTIAERALEPTHTTRLGLALSYALFQHEVLQSPHGASKMALAAVKIAVAQRDRDTSRPNSARSQERSPRFLPMSLDGVAVLIHEGDKTYRADPLPGFDKVAYRLSKNLDHWEVDNAGGVGAWRGTKVYGQDEGDGWLRVAQDSDILIQSLHERAASWTSEQQVAGLWETCFTGMLESSLRTEQ